MEFLTTKSKINQRKYCANCIKGLFPGKIIDNMTLIQREGKGYWKIKCNCGVIFKSLLNCYKGRIASCGCRKRKEIIEASKKKIGLKYKHLKITKTLGFIDKHLWIELKCICGKTIQRPNGNEFKSASCGCRWHENVLKGSSCHFSKLNEAECLSLRELYKSECYSIQELVKIYGLSKQTIKMILSRDRWAHI